MTDDAAPAGREQPWVDPAEEDLDRAHVVVVTDNPVGRAVRQIALTTGRHATLLPDDDLEDGAATPYAWLEAHPPTARDAVVLCDHDTPDMERLLRLALDGEAGYVAMLGSRRRAEGVFAALSQEYPPETLARLHVPAGLNTGGKTPGEIALSVVAEVVAVANGRPGGPMRG